MDAEIREYLDEEKRTHAEIVERQTLIMEKTLKHEKHIDSHTSHLKEMCESMRAMNKTLEDFAALSGLAKNIETIANFGRLVRTIVLWTAGIVGGIALIWASIKTGFKQ